MKRTGKIITAVVLTLGIAGGTAAYGKYRFGDPAKRADYVMSYIGDELELDSIQMQSLAALKDQIMAARETMHGNMGNVHTEASAMIAAEQFDKGRALELVNEKTSSINSIAPEIVGALGNFLDSLNADQKAEIAEFFTKHHDRHHRGHHWGRGGVEKRWSDSADK